MLAALKKVKDMNLTVNGQSVIPLQLNGKNYQGETLQYLQRTFGAMPIDKDGKFRNILFVSGKQACALSSCLRQLKADISIRAR